MVRFFFRISGGQDLGGEEVELGTVPSNHAVQDEKRAKSAKGGNGVKEEIVYDVVYDLFIHCCSFK